jgi:hypothetical protein
MAHCRPRIETIDLLLELFGCADITAYDANKEVRRWTFVGPRRYRAPRDSTSPHNGRMIERPVERRAFDDEIGYAAEAEQRPHAMGILTPPRPPERKLLDYELVDPKNLGERAPV